MSCLRKMARTNLFFYDFGCKLYVYKTFFTVKTRSSRQEVYEEYKIKTQMISFKDVLILRIVV